MSRRPRVTVSRGMGAHISLFIILSSTKRIIMILKIDFKIKLLTDLSFSLVEFGYRLGKGAPTSCLRWASILQQTR